MDGERVRGVVQSGLVSLNEPAPDFALPALIGGVRKNFRLADLTGKSVVLAFYPHNWRESSARQMASYQAERPRLLACNAETVAINVESIMNTTAWERACGPFDFTLCSDFWPHGAVCRRYGVLRESGPGSGASECALFVVSPAGRIVFCKAYQQDTAPLLDEVFPVLERV